MGLYYDCEVPGCGDCRQLDKAKPIPKEILCRDCEEKINNGTQDKTERMQVLDILENSLFYCVDDYLQPDLQRVIDYIHSIPKRGE